VPTSLADLTRASFEAHVSSRFTLRAGERALELELIEVKALGATTPQRREPFSLLFRGPRDAMAPQGTYALEHGRLGTLSIFIVPLGLDATGMLYEAVFA
jgi:hypothetical protein